MEKWKTTHHGVVFRTIILPSTGPAIEKSGAHHPPCPPVPGEPGLLPPVEDTPTPGEALVSTRPTGVGPPRSVHRSKQDPPSAAKGRAAKTGLSGRARGGSNWNEKP